MKFDLYFAGDSGKIAMGGALETLVPRLFNQLTERRAIEMHTKAIESGKYHKLFVDSGAYPAWSRGASVDIDDYISFINNHTYQCEIIASLDSIPGKLRTPATIKERKQAPVKSWENYLYMRERLLEPEKLIPVFHLGEDFSHLINMIETKLDEKYISYIGLGGTVGQPLPNKIKWYNSVFKIIKDSKNPNVKTHAFGMTSIKLLENYPFTSADSTSWILTGAMGNIYTQYGTVIVSDKGADKSNHISKLDKKQQEIIINQVESYGISFDNCVDGEGSCQYRALVNLHYMKKWAENYEFKGNNRYQKTLF